MQNFDEYRHKGLRFYKKVARELEVPDDLAFADRLVTAFLGVLRERMTFQESLELVAALPMHVKGVYVHGWKFNNSPKRLASEEELLQAIRIKYPYTTGRKLGDDAELKKYVSRLLTVIQQEALGKGIQDIRKILPPALHNFCDYPKPVVEIINEGDKHFPEVQPIKNEM